MAQSVLTVAFRTLGCKLNQCETAQMEEALARRGYRVVEWEGEARVRVLNTCTVTAKTDRACRHEISRAKRRDPDSRLAVTGCYAQVAADKVAAIPGVELVLGNLDKFDLADHLDRLLASPQNGCAALSEVTPYTEQGCDGGGFAAEDGGDGCGQALAGLREASVELSSAGRAAAAGSRGFEGEFITHFAGYTRAFLKVQNGCNAACSYCIIPTARGQSRSMRLADVKAQVKLLGEQGYAEVVLTGIHLGAWGRDSGEGVLADLLRGLLEVEEVPRYRLSSTEPMEVDDRVLAVMRGSEGRFAEHLHVPLQSGSDSVLRRMNRPYRRAAYSDRVQAIREAFPEAAIGADVIVGFPGESEEEFAETMEFVAGLPLTYLHVFAYSDRPGTRASAMASKVKPETISARSERLRALGAEKNQVFQQAFRGRTLEALLLRQRAEDGRIVGLTSNYLEVLVEGGDELMNRYAPVTLADRESAGRWSGRLAGPARPNPWREAASA